MASSYEGGAISFIDAGLRTDPDRVPAAGDGVVSDAGVLPVADDVRVDDGAGRAPTLSRP